MPASSVMTSHPMILELPFTAFPMKSTEKQDGFESLGWLRGPAEDQLHVACTTFYSGMSLAVSTTDWGLEQLVSSAPADIA